MKQRYGFFTLLLLLALPSYATHIVGGEFRLTHSAGKAYELQMLLYFDEFYGNPTAEDESIVVGIFERRTHNRVKIVTLERTSSRQVNYRNPACLVEQLRTRQIRYEAPLLLPADAFSDPDGYYISWERCCRNAQIVNLKYPAESGMTFYLEFPPVTRDGVAFNNSSPSFSLPYAEYACLDEPFVFPFAATDADGDQLRYRLVDPLRGHASQFNPVIFNPWPGPYRPVVWQPGYGATQSISGSVPLRIDSLSGRLELTADKPGLYVFSVMCEERRQGRLIGRVQRDFQLLATECPRNAPPALTVSTAPRNRRGAGNTYRPGDTITVTGAADRCVKLQLTDPDFREQIRLGATAVNYVSPAPLLDRTSALLMGAGDTITLEVCALDCNAPADRIYEMRITAEDDGCPVQKQAEAILYFRLEPPPNRPPTLTLLPEPYALGQVTHNVGDLLVLDLLGTDPDPQDRLEITLVGALPGMDFQTAPGQGQVRAQLTWQPDCSLLAAGIDSVVLRFLVKDGTCFAPIPDTISVVLRLRDRFSEAAVLEPPNVFTPNGDDVNDFYYMKQLPEDNCVSQFRYVDIYNRWGKRVFRSDTRDFQWDGGQLPVGVYYYHVQYSNDVYKGTVTLLR